MRTRPAANLASSPGRIRSASRSRSSGRPSRTAPARAPAARPAGGARAGEPFPLLRQAESDGPRARPVVEVGPQPWPDLLYLAQEDRRARGADALDLLDQPRRALDVAGSLPSEPPEV